MWDQDPSNAELADWILTVYQTLASHIFEVEEDVSVEEAITVVVEATNDELNLPREDAEYAIQRLVNRGYLYTVDGDLFVTEEDIDDDISEIN